MARRWRPSGSKPSWARCCLSVSCWTPRSPPWRPTALWPAGGRDDEPDRLALKRPALWPGPRVPGLARLARHHLPPSLLLPARTAPASGPGWADAGCRAGRRHPRGPDREPGSRRGLSEGLGPAARRGPSHIQAPGAAAHAREQPASAYAPPKRRWPMILNAAWDVTQAADVANEIANRLAISDLTSKAKHLVEVSAAPRWLWSALVGKLVESDAQAALRSGSGAPAERPGSRPQGPSLPLRNFAP